MTPLKEKLFHFFNTHLAKFLIIIFYVVVLLTFLFIPKISTIQSNSKKSLTIIIFPEAVSVDVLRAFTEETGIEINAKNVENDAELKIYADENQGTYDLACIPEYLVDELAATNKLEPLDQNLIPNYSKIHELFKESQYPLIGIPFVWTLFGIGINSSDIPVPENPSWNLLFNPQYKVCVPDDPRLLITLGALALEKPLNRLSNDTINKIVDLLFKEKKHVELYTDTNIALLFANNIVPLAFCSYKTLNNITKLYPNIFFLIPKEGGIKASQEWVILKNCKKTSLAHQFINFVISKKMAKLNDQNTDFLPTQHDILEKYWKSSSQKNNMCQLPLPHKIKQAKQPCGNISAQKISDLWITLKSS